MCSWLTELQEEVVRPQSGDVVPFNKPILRMSAVMEVEQWLLLSSLGPDLSFRRVSRLRLEGGL